jgi:hypothetical protein
MFGHNKHSWIWGFSGIAAALAITSILRCEMGDSGDSAFASVEQHDRFFDEPTGTRELAVHCQRPADR